MATRNESALIKSALIICIIGAINWGLIGFFNFNLVNAVFGHGAREPASALSRLIYAIVGIAGVIAASLLNRVRTRGAVAEEPLLGARRTPTRP